MLSIIQDLGKILSYKQKIHLIFIFLSIGFLTKPVIANDIFTAQRLLTELGYAPGPIDGAYGGKTKKAFVELYKDQNMNFDQYIEYTEEKFWDNLIVRFSFKLLKLKNFLHPIFECFQICYISNIF